MIIQAETMDFSVTNTMTFESTHDDQKKIMDAGIWRRRPVEPARKCSCASA